MTSSPQVGLSATGCVAATFRRLRCAAHAALRGGSARQAALGPDHAALAAAACSTSLRHHPIVGEGTASAGCQASAARRGRRAPLPPGRCRRRPRAASARQLQRRLCEVDLAAEERHARAVPLGLGDQLEGIAGRPRPAAEHADDQFGIEAGQLLQRLRTVKGNLQELGPLGLRQAGQRLQNDVVEELADLVEVEADIDVRVEDLVEVLEVVGSGLGAEQPELLQRAGVDLRVVEERDRVEPEVGAGDRLPGGRLRVPVIARESVTERKGREGTLR